MNLKDNEMSRGLNQALYKYLPDAWIDFYIRKTRTAYTAKVRNWNSGELQNINKKRMLEQVKLNLKAFENAGGQLNGFGADINEDSYTILTPKRGINADIIAEISPLTFFCSDCKKVYRLTSSESVMKHDTMYSKCCNKPLRQISLIYACECGWAGPVEPIPCKIHKFDHLKYTGKYSYICTIDNKEMQMVKICPKCGRRLGPKNALDQSNYIPFSFSAIDLVNMKEEEFLSKEELGPKIILAYWLGGLTETEYRNLIGNGIPKDDDLAKKYKYAETYNSFINSGMSKGQAEKYARMAVYGVSNNSVDKAQDFIDTYILDRNKEKLNRYSVSILEYYKIYNSKNISTIEDAKKISKQLNTNANPEIYDETAERFGIKHVQACGNVPFVFCSYGYTRKKSDPEGDSNDYNKKLTLNAFPAEYKDKKNVYASNLNTEGVLFEFDKKRIIEWLIKNEFINNNEMPNDLNNDAELKRWFINEVDITKIPTFTKINKDDDKITYYVYNLLHSISHALIRQAAQLCGLDKNSLSEYIFPSVPAVFIYCQNSQGFSLGALFNLFEAYFDRWLKLMLLEVEKCVFDPICIDRDRACAGCLYLNEVSCTHFNKDLDRRFLIGHYDKTTGNRIYGFWESE